VSLVYRESIGTDANRLMLWHMGRVVDLPIPIPSCRHRLEIRRSSAASSLLSQPVNSRTTEDIIERT
jgi:hypothetical protein